MHYVIKKLLIEPVENLEYNLCRVLDGLNLSALAILARGLNALVYLDL
jgi:hypothetical protein